MIQPAFQPVSRPGTKSVLLTRSKHKNHLKVDASAVSSAQSMELVQMLLEACKVATLKGKRVRLQKTSAKTS